MIYPAYLQATSGQPPLLHVFSEASCRRNKMQLRDQVLPCVSLFGSCMNMAIRLTSCRLEHHQHYLFIEKDSHGEHIHSVLISS